MYVHLYLRDMASFGEANAAYCRFFGAHPPSRSCVAASLGPHRHALVDAFAMAGSGAEMRRGRLRDRQVGAVWVCVSVSVCVHVRVCECVCANTHVRARTHTPAYKTHTHA